MSRTALLATIHLPNIIISDARAVLVAMEKTEELMKKLESPSQRFIEITIGEDTSRTFYVAQQTLESLSPYFFNALKDDTFAEGRAGELSFSEDDVDVWKELMYWIHYHKTASPTSASDLHLAVRCWSTGDKYGIEAFQDAVMLTILQTLDDTQRRNSYLNMAVIRVLFERTVEKALLRELFLDYIIMDCSRDSSSLQEWLSGSMMTSDQYSAVDFASLDGLGFYPAMMEKKLRFEKEGKDALKWMHDGDGSKNRPDWAGFFFNSWVYHGKCDDSEA